ncbi:hypothetical protein [Algoriphagus boritolerans]|uniref:hypothetical protein n=1 Tax=Algoriphagus boritolerans TaxID=308111 RepID=UPI002FCE1B46
MKKGRIPKDTIFTYGWKEEILMKALGENGKITLKEFAGLAKVPRFLASKTLVRLVSANVLKIHPQESEDFFYAQRIGKMMPVFDLKPAFP